jgi:hypothetical protein
MEKLVSDCQIKILFLERIEVVLSGPSPLLFGVDLFGTILTRARIGGF